VPQHINSVEYTLIVHARRPIFARKIRNIYVGDKIIAKKKEPKFLPAEMVSINIKKSDLLTNSKEIIIRVE
jgi:hypothetical protein